MEHLKLLELKMKSLEDEANVSRNRKKVCRMNGIVLLLVICILLPRIVTGALIKKKKRYCNL